MVCGVAVAQRSYNGLGRLTRAADGDALLLRSLGAEDSADGVGEVGVIVVRVVLVLELPVAAVQGLLGAGLLANARRSLIYKEV